MGGAERNPSWRDRRGPREESGGPPSGSGFAGTRPRFAPPLLSAPPSPCPLPARPDAQPDEVCAGHDLMLLYYRGGGINGKGLDAVFEAPGEEDAC